MFLEIMAKAGKLKKNPSEAAGGTYVYDKELGKVVKVSDRIPKVASKGKGASSDSPCGRPVCGGGRCAGMGS